MIINHLVIKNMYSYFVELNTYSFRIYFKKLLKNHYAESFTNSGESQHSNTNFLFVISIFISSISLNP